MKALAHKERLGLTTALSILLDELDGECQRTIKLIENLQSHDLADKQTEDFLGELSATVTHLRIHSEQVEKAIEEELEKEA